MQAETSTQTDTWGVPSGPMRGPSSGFSLFHRNRDYRRTGSDMRAPDKAASGYHKGSAAEDGDGSDSSSVMSASMAAGASFVTQSTSTTAQTAPPPSYSTLYVPVAGIDSSASPDAFHPTLQLHIDAAGRGACMTTALFTPGPDATSVYVVDDNAASSATSPAFISLRKSRGSGSCSLVAGAGYAAISNEHHSAATGDALRTLSTTTYRFGPGRPPRIDLGGNLSATATAPHDTLAPWDSFEVQSKSIWSRSQRVRTSLGTFEWRYASSAERKDLSKELLWQAGAGKEEDGRLCAGDKKERKRKQKQDKAARKHHDVKSLLVLEQVVQVFGSADASGPSSASAGGPREVRRCVARLIRNAELRTPGSSRHAAGNGGRLQIDLRAWAAAREPALDEKKQEADCAPICDSYDREMMVVMVVSTAFCMLKKEVDRRKGEEAAAFSAAAS